MSDLRAFHQQVDDCCDALILAIRSAGRAEWEWAVRVVEVIKRHVK